MIHLSHCRKIFASVVPASDRNYDGRLLKRDLEREGEECRNVCQIEKELEAADTERREKKVK